MVRILLSLILLIPFVHLYGQDQSGNDYYFGDNFYFHGYHTDMRMMHHSSVVFQINDKYVWDIYDRLDSTDKFNNKVKEIKPNSPILLGIKLTPKLKNFFSTEVPNFSKAYNSYLIPDSSPATIIAMGINKHNITNYQYRLVLDDDIEIVKWSPIVSLEKKYGAKEPYGNIGTFRYPGKKLLVEVAHKDSIGIRDGYIIDWTIQKNPIIEQIIVRGASKYGYYGLNLDSLRQLKKNNRGYKDDHVLHWTFEKDSIKNFELHFAQHETRPYSLYLVRDRSNKKDTISLAWWEISKRFTIENQYLNELGKYSLYIQQTGTFGEYPKNQITQLAFEIIEPASKEVTNTYSLQQLIPIIVGVLIFISLAFLYYRWLVRRKLKQTARERELITIQMRGIRSQLNPHFMFNSINSIQNLILRGDVSLAQQYLSTFSALTREVLDDSENEMHSLSAELKLIDDYLMLEQLRFGFQYSITNQLEMHPDNIDIPVMLFQPFVENAVKHGVSNLLNKGEIDIMVYFSSDHLILEVRDNGEGMKTSIPSSGFGIKLSQKRVDLLNLLFPLNNIEIHFIDNQKGVVVQIVLKDWLI